MNLTEDRCPLTDPDHIVRADTPIWDEVLASRVLVGSAS